MLINSLNDLCILAALEANANMTAAALTTNKGLGLSTEELDDIAVTAWASARCLVDQMPPGIKKTLNGN